MAKPSAPLIWCTSNPTDGTSGQDAIIEPSAGKKASGFLRLEQPPRQDFNWLFNLTGLWVSYLEEITDAHNWNLQALANNQNKDTDLTTSNDLIQESLDARYLDDDFITGLRVDGFIVNATDVGVVITRGSARMSDRLFTVNTDQYGGGNTYTKYIKKGASAFPYVFGDGEVGHSVGVGPFDASWYHVFLVYNNTTGLFDIGFDDSIQGTNLLAVSGIDRVRRIFSLYYIDATSGFRVVQQYGDYFAYDANQYLVFDTDPSVTASPRALDLSSFVPAGIDTMAKLRSHIQFTGLVTGTSAILNASHREAPNFGSDPADYLNAITDGRVTSFGDTTEYQITDKDVPLTNIDSHVINLFYNSSSAGNIRVVLVCYGYYDLRGKDWGYKTADTIPGRYFN